jgi:hypothetical protein
MPLIILVMLVGRPGSGPTSGPHGAVAAAAEGPALRQARSGAAAVAPQRPTPPVGVGAGGPAAAAAATVSNTTRPGGASNMTAVTVNVMLNLSAKKQGCLHSMVGFRFDWLCCNIRLQHHRLALHLP